MFEKMFRLLGYERNLTSENALELIAASERRASGWFRTLDREQRFLGFRFYCPGRFIKTTRPAFNGERDATGKLVTGEVPIMQRTGCAFVSSEILPIQTLADVNVRCGQCGTESVLLTWMRENKIVQFESIPSESRVPSRSRTQMMELGGDNVGEYSYELSDPGGRI